jgi:hypothetical protein
MMSEDPFTCISFFRLNSAHVHFGQLLRDANSCFSVLSEKLEELRPGDEVAGILWLKCG